MERNRETEKAAPPGAAEPDEMTQYGIERVTTETYTFRNYRYTNLADALAHAKLELSRES